MAEDPSAPPEIPELLKCPECSALLKNATELPCCRKCLCRPCAYKKLMLNKKLCWFQTTPQCSSPLSLDKLSPALEIRELVQDFIDGGTKYKDRDQEDEDRSIPEYIDCVDVSLPRLPVVIKTETPCQDEEYSELGSGIPSIKTETSGFTNSQTSGFNSFTSETLGFFPTLESFPEFALNASVGKKETILPPSALKEEVSVKSEKVVVAGEEEEKEPGEEEEGEVLEGFSPRPYTLPNTPSSVRTEHQSSGYWSDDTFEGPFFGKLHWELDDPGQGYIECWDGDEMKKAYVSRLDVKCGAESGDLVEFTLKTDSEHGKVARRVKLVEKGLPASDEDQIKSQERFKRSLEIYAADKFQNEKKMKVEDIIDAETELQGMTSSYMDIAAEEDPVPWNTENIKSEMNELLSIEEPASETCICSSSTLSRCGLCPMYILRSESQHTILEAESITFLARIVGEYEDIKFVRHLPFPFQISHGFVDFKLLASLGTKCIVKKVTPVFKHNYVFVSVMNDTEFQVNISPGDVLGICQAHQTQESEVSQNFIMEPPDRQDAGLMPILVKKKDFTRYEENHVCGFAEIGSIDMNYKFCLVKIKLLPEYESKFSLLKDEMTVQIKRNVWLEFIPRSKGYENLLPKNGIIGHAMSVMNEFYVEDLFKSVSPIPSSVMKDEKAGKRESESNVDPYESMMMKLDKDICSVVSTQKGDSAAKLNILDKTLRGVTNEKIEIDSGSERTLTLFLQSDEFDPKTLLKMQVDITNNEEFKYFNNCYNIEPQVCTVTNSTCKQTNTSLPCVKVTVKNQRTERATLPVNSSIALVKIHHKPNSKILKTPVPEPRHHNKRSFSAAKALEKHERRCNRIWENILSEKTFARSFEVETKFPYFTAQPKPKIPFGLKLPELLMRVGQNQESIPTRVLDKVSGVFTCTICDTLILDKYTLQDHVYSVRHKNNMKQFQVIAGVEERLFMNRPVIQEMLDQFRGCQLLGLDYLFEVLQGSEQALYNCALCNQSFDEYTLMSHLISVHHVFTFIKEFFPLAWVRLSSIQDVEKWTEIDLECFHSIIEKIDSVFGQRKPSIVANEEQLEKAVEKIPTNLYATKRGDLDTFFRNLKPSDSSPVHKPKLRSKLISRIAISVEHLVVSPGAVDRIKCKINNVPISVALESNFVLVTRNPSNTSCDIKPGISRVFLKGRAPHIYVNVVNSRLDSSIQLEPYTEIALIKWKK